MKYIFIFPANVFLTIFLMLIFCFFCLRIVAYTIWHFRVPAHDQWKVRVLTKGGVHYEPETPAMLVKDFRKVTIRDYFTRFITQIEIT